MKAAFRAAPFLRLFGFLFLGAGLAGCARKEEEKYADGKTKTLREYSLFGPKDSLRLRRLRTYYFNGNPEQDFSYRRGKLHGDYRTYWHNGQLKEKGRTVDGRREGEWEFYFNRFVLSAQGAYLRGHKHGLWTEYWESSDLRRRGEYREGREIGEWISWSPEGPESERNSCFESNPEGRYRSWHGNGAPKEEYACRAGKKTGPYAEYHPEGDVQCRGFFDSAGRRDSLWECFHPGGTPASRRHYRAGLWEDSSLAWDAAGRVVERGFFRSGTGILSQYDSLGRLAETRPYAQGELDGEVLRFHPGGARRKAQRYSRGTPLTQKRWHANGTLAMEGFYAEGKPTGLWREWNSKGFLRESAEYVNGELHGERRFFDSAGKLIRVQKYHRGMPTRGAFPGLRSE